MDEGSTDIFTLVLSGKDSTTTVLIWVAISKSLELVEVSTISIRVELPSTISI